METSLQDNSVELLLLKRRQLALKRQQLEIKRKWGLLAYTPHEKQAAFHSAGVQFKRRMLRAGNRFGKTVCGCAEDCAWLLNERLWLPVEHPARRGGIPQKPNKILCIAQDWDLVHELWTDNVSRPGGKIWTMLPRDGFVKSVSRHSGSRAIDEIQCTNGSVLRFDTVKSFINDARGAESKDWDAIHVDEPCPELMYKAHARGLMDRDGASWFTLTPLSEAWINDMFFPADTGGASRSDVWATTGTIFDNPYVSAAGRDAYIASLNDEEKQCRIYGIPLHLAGLIYKAFTWSKHVLQKLPQGWKSWTEPPEDYTVFVAIDPHPRTPHAVLFCAVDPVGRRYYFADIFDHCKISDLCEKIKRVLNGRPVYSIRVDPSADIPDPVTDRSMLDEFWACGVPAEKSSKALADGILRVQGELAADPQCVYFCPTAVRTLWEIQRYSWDPKREDKPLDKDDHCMECLYRIEIQEPRWVDSKFTGEPLSDQTFERLVLETTDLELGAFNE